MIQEGSASIAGIRESTNKPRRINKYISEPIAKDRL